MFPGFQPFQIFCEKIILRFVIHSVDIFWYLATALAKQWEATIPYLEERRLPEWVHRKTIQKAIESYRITPEQKVYLKSLR